MEEETQVELVAYALYFQRSGAPVTIITEDVLALPFRASVAEAAASLGMSVQTMEQFMIANGL